MTVATEIKPNTLVMYEGGGYEGCSWEYNYAFLDEEGAFHDIASSGYNGCNTQEELLDRYEEHPKDFDLYDLNKDEEKKRFADEAPISHLVGVAKWFNEQGLQVCFPVECSACEAEVGASYCEGESPSGCGGIAMKFNEIICVDCKSLGTCAYCGEYVGTEDMADHETTDNGYCKWCEKTHGSHN